MSFSNHIKPYLMILLRLTIAGIFIVSAISKLYAPGLFEVILMNQDIAADRSIATYLSRVLIGIELTIGLLFLQPYLLRKIVAPFTVLLLFVFSVQLVHLILLNDRGNCGCFGEWIQMSPSESLFKNIIIITLVAILYRNSSPIQNKYSLPIVVTVAAFAITFVIAPIRQHENNQFSRFTWFEGAGNVDLTHGDHLVALFTIECEHCRSIATEINILQGEIPDLPKMVVLFYSENNGTVEDFNAMTGTNFPYQMIKPEIFFTLIGKSPPRVYVLHDGAIIQYLDDNIITNLLAFYETKASPE